MSNIQFMYVLNVWYILGTTTKLEIAWLALWQYGLWSFQTGGTKLERFLPKNEHTQRKFLNFENWTNGEVSKVQNHPTSQLSKSIFYVKIIRIFLNFFSH